MAKRDRMASWTRLSCNRKGTPADRLGIFVQGNLAAMLALATNAKRPSTSDDLQIPVTMVAGGRHQRYCARYPVCA